MTMGDYKKLSEADDRGKSVGYDQAYREGYAAKYDEWTNRDNPYPERTPESDGFDDGYCEAVTFA